MRMGRARLIVVAVLTGALLPALADAQTPATQPSAAVPPDEIAAAVATAVKTAQVAEQPATLEYANRPIVTLRATVLSRSPSARVGGVVHLLDGLVTTPPAGRVTTHPYDDAVLLRVGGHPVLVVFSADVDLLAGERLDTKAAEAATRLQVAVDESVELHNPSALLKAGLLALAATVVYVLVIWGLIRVHRRASTRVTVAAEKQLRRLPGGEIIVTVAHAPAYVQRALTSLLMLVGLLVTYQWLIFVLRHLPYTRPLGESLRTGLQSVTISAGQAVVDQLPNLAKVLVIVVVTRFLVRLAGVAFDAVAQERVTLPWIYPETAAPTRRIVTALLWLFALIVSYPFLPGSQSEVFKGASVFIGIIVSLGSTGVMNQIMSGFMVTYSRAVRSGDFVKIGDVEGTVTHLGALSTKVRTARNEDVTIPNVVVVSQTTTNYSRNAKSLGVLVPTSITIGYDAPWRQVHALLLMAAERTPGLRQEPKPVVLQTALEDFYVKYTLLVALEDQDKRVRTLATLHANIQDAFNEYRRADHVAALRVGSPGCEDGSTKPVVLGAGGTAIGGRPTDVPGREVWPGLALLSLRQSLFLHFLGRRLGEVGNKRLQFLRIRCFSD